MEKEKKPNIFYQIIDVVTDILIIPIVVLCIVCTVVMFNSRTHNQIPSIFGYSAVQVVSGSMIASGFNIGDVALIKRVPISEIRTGDIIAYYELADYTIENKITTLCRANGYTSSDQDSANYELKYFFDNDLYQMWNGNTDVYISNALTGTNEDEITKAGDSNCRVIFHEVKMILRDSETGALYFRTKGSSNPNYDAHWWRESSIVGVYQPNAAWFGEVISFCGSVEGIIYLIEIPCGIMLLMLSVQLIQQIDDWMQEKDGVFDPLLKHGILKNKIKAKAKVLRIRRSSAKRFVAWFNKYIYFNSTDAKGAQIRRVRNAKLALQKSVIESKVGLEKNKKGNK